MITNIVVPSVPHSYSTICPKHDLKIVWVVSPVRRPRRPRQARCSFRLWARHSFHKSWTSPKKFCYLCVCVCVERFMCAYVYVYTHTYACFLSLSLCRYICIYLFTYVYRHTCTSKFWHVPRGTTPLHLAGIGRWFLQQLPHTNVVLQHCLFRR